MYCKQAAEHEIATGPDGSCGWLLYSTVHQNTWRLTFKVTLHYVCPQLRLHMWEVPSIRSSVLINNANLTCDWHRLQGKDWICWQSLPICSGRCPVPVLCQWYCDRDGVMGLSLMLYSGKDLGRSPAIKWCMILHPLTSPKYVMCHSLSVRTQGSPKASCVRWLSSPRSWPSSVPQVQLLGNPAAGPQLLAWPAHAIWECMTGHSWSGNGLVVSVFPESERTVAVICGSWPPFIATCDELRLLSRPLFVFLCSMAMVGITFWTTGCYLVMVSSSMS